MATAKTAKQKKGCAYIRKIQVAIRQLGLDEESYRGLYERLTGQRSLRAMSVPQRQKVIRALEGMGFNNRGQASGDVARCQTPAAKRIRHEWLKLKALGELRDPSERALLAYVKRLTCLSRMEWLKPAQAAMVIESLKNWVQRVENGQARRADGTSGDAA